MNFAQIRDNFLDELNKASLGERTSLAYIPTTFPEQPFLQEGPFQAIVIGGTHYHALTATLAKDGTITHIANEKKGQLPKLQTEKIFLGLMQELLDPTITYVCLNFAYPLDPVLRSETLDAKLTYPTKEHAFEGMLNKLVGQTIEEAIKATTGKTINVIVANDATCLVLAGLEQRNKREHLAGCIVGSGFNMAFFTDANTIVTLEAGSFDKVESTTTGKQIDEESMDPGRATFEKEVSGLYLYRHYNLLHEQNHLAGPLLKDSKELSDLAEKGKTPESYLARDLLKRSAALVATQLAGLYLFKNKPEQLNFVIEGSVIHDGWHYQPMIQEALKELGVPSGAIKLAHVEDSSLVGAAKLLTIHKNN